MRVRFLPWVPFQTGVLMTTKVTVHANGESYPAYVYRGQAEDDANLSFEAKLINEQRDYYIYNNGIILVSEVDLVEKGLVEPTPTTD